jgi:hypothetical protein
MKNVSKNLVSRKTTCHSSLIFCQHIFKTLLIIHQDISLTTIATHKKKNENKSSNNSSCLTIGARKILWQFCSAILPR